MLFMRSIKSNIDQLTPGQIAGALSVSVSTIWRWKKKGCPYKETRENAIGKHASRPRYDLEAVKSWIQEQTGKGVEV
jgi:phage terminase Nu1 subunit (DNA packaging protein)